MKGKFTTLTVIPVTATGVCFSARSAAAWKATNSFDGMILTKDFYKGRSHSPWTV
jgi:hypothetical protein